MRTAMPGHRESTAICIKATSYTCPPLVPLVMAFTDKFSCQKIERPPCLWLPVTIEKQYRRWSSQYVKQKKTDWTDK